MKRNSYQSPFKIMNKKQFYLLLEWHGVDPAAVPDYQEFWALYATSFYEKLFGKIDDRNQLDKVYQHWIDNPKLNRKSRAALTFFYNIRRDEMDDPDYWSKVGMGKLPENKQEPMKAKLVKESLNEYPDWLSDGSGPETEDEQARLEAEEEARQITKADPGIIQHVNKIRDGLYRVEDWYDYEQTVSSFVNGMKESLNVNKVFESMSRYSAIWKANNGKWYLDLAPNEYGEEEDADTYGPFGSEDAADSYLSNNFSNPGGGWVDDSGDREPPTESPNGSKVKNPRSGGGGMMMGGYGRRW